MRTVHELREILPLRIEGEQILVLKPTKYMQSQNNTENMCVALSHLSVEISPADRSSTQAPEATDHQRGGGPLD